MTHYNNNNNAYCSAVNDQIFKTRDHNIVKISTFFTHKKPMFLFTFRDIHLHL